MTGTLNLKPKVEAEITQKAAAEGTGVSDYLEKMIEAAVKSQPRVVYSQEQLTKNQAALAMLWEGFKKGMNENHTSSRVLFP